MSTKEILISWQMISERSLARLHLYCARDGESEIESERTRERAEEKKKRNIECRKKMLEQSKTMRENEMPPDVSYFCVKFVLKHQMRCFHVIWRVHNRTDLRY